jgi:hypothetical protein
VLQKLIHPLLFITINILFPLYFIDRFSAGWDEAVHIGWYWMLIFFAICLAFIVIQYMMGNVLTKRVSVFKTGSRKELILMFTAHNFGYLPLPLLAPIVPDSVLIFLFFFIMAYNVMFWSFMVSFITEKGGPRFTFKLNAPMIGIAGGLIIAIFRLYEFFPKFVSIPIHYSGEAALNLVVVLLGAILATIPVKHLTFKPVFGWFIFFKMILYPAAVLIILLFVPFPGLSKAMANGIKIALIVEAVMPPATNIMIATKAYGTEEQVNFVGNGIVITYIAALGVIPIFLLLTNVLFM